MQKKMEIKSKLRDPMSVNDCLNFTVSFPCLTLEKFTFVLAFLLDSLDKMIRFLGALLYMPATASVRFTPSYHLSAFLSLILIPFPLCSNVPSTSLSFLFVSRVYK